MKNYNYLVMPGNNFDSAAQNAQQIAKEKGIIVEFTFNGVLCRVNKHTNLEWLYRDYSNSWTMEWKTVGPDCVEKYSEEVQTDLEKRMKIRDEERAQEEAEYLANESKERANFETRIQGVKLELSDAEGWEKSRKINSDGYGSSALDYAEGWAKLMQLEIAKGRTIAECYDYTQEGLGFFGITGFQFGCAVSILSQTWKHGEELRKVHNKKYGVSEDKKGTVNPAILTIKT